MSKADMDCFAMKKVIGIVSGMDMDQRRAVEEKKLRVRFDELVGMDVLAASRMRNQPDEVVEETVNVIRDYYNVIIAMFALCETQDEVHRRSQLTNISGRIPKPRYRKRVPNQLQSAIRQVMEQVDQSLQFSTPGSNNRKLNRAKTRHAANLIATLLNTYGVSELAIPWEQFTVAE